MADIHETLSTDDFDRVAGAEEREQYESFSGILEDLLRVHEGPLFLVQTSGGLIDAIHSNLGKVNVVIIDNDEYNLLPDEVLDSIGEYTQTLKAVY
jgi:hypothetical protein